MVQSANQVCSSCSKSMQSLTLAVVQECPVAVNVRCSSLYREAKLKRDKCIHLPPVCRGTLHWARQWPDYVTDVVKELMMHDKTGDSEREGASEEERERVGSEAEREKEGKREEVREEEVEAKLHCELVEAAKLEEGKISGV